MSHHRSRTRLRCKHQYEDGKCRKCDKKQVETPTQDTSEADAA